MAAPTYSGSSSAGGYYGAYTAVVQSYREQTARRLARQQGRALDAMRRYMYQQLVMQITGMRYQAQLAQDEARRREVYRPVAFALAGTPGTTTLTVEPFPSVPLPKTWKAAKATGEFATRREYRQERRHGAPPQPIQVTVPTYGINNPIVRGSRDDLARG